MPIHLKLHMVELLLGTTTYPTCTSTIAKFSPSINFCQFPSNCKSRHARKYDICISCWNWMCFVYLYDVQHHSKPACLVQLALQPSKPDPLKLSRIKSPYWILLRKVRSPRCGIPTFEARKATTNFSFFSLAYTHSCLAAKHEHHYRIV